MSINSYMILIICIVLLAIFIIKIFSKKSNSHSNKNNIYVLRTHIWNEYVENTYYKMQEQLGAEKVFVLFDETNSELNVPSIKWNDTIKIQSGPAIIRVNENDCSKLNTLHNIGERTGSRYRVEGQVIACYKSISCNYDYMWFFEFDVYSKNFKIAFDKFGSINADLLTKGTANMRQATFRTHGRNKKWYWWPHLIGEISNTPISERRGCFFPINRFSKKFLSVLEDNLSKSSGYCEVYFPTLCYKTGLKLETMALKNFGNFKDKPNISSEKLLELKENDYRLYHPVKELSSSSFYKIRDQKSLQSITN